MNIREILDKIFKDPKITYELTEFDNLGSPISEIINIYQKFLGLEEMLVKRNTL